MAVGYLTWSASVSLPSGDTGDSQIELVSRCWEPIRRYGDRLEGWGIRRPTRVRKTGSSPRICEVPC